MLSLRILLFLKFFWISTGLIVSHLWCEHFLSTTVQLPATQRKVEGEERDIQLINVNEANSCIAQGYCVHCSPCKESGAYQAPLPHPRTPHC